MRAIMLKMNKETAKAVSLAVSLALAAFLIYLPTLRSGFIWDDIQLLANPYQVGSNPYAFFFGGGVYYRPFLRLSMLFDYGLWHLAPAGYHLTNLLLHTGNSLLVFLVGFHLLKNQQLTPAVDVPAKRGFENPLILSFVSACLFALHPIHTESVAWISARTDLLSTFFFLLAFLACLEYSRKGTNTGLVICGLFFLFSLFAKENAVAFIGVALAYGILIGIGKKRLLLLAGTLVTTCLIYLSFRQARGIEQILTAGGANGAFFSSALTPKELMEVLIKGTGYYIEKLLFPFNLNFLPKVPEESIYVVFCFLPFIVAVFLYLGRHRLKTFLIVWILATLSPCIPVLFSQMSAPIGERYLYLPSAGLTILLASFLTRIKYRKVVLASTLAVLLTYAITTHERLIMWKDDATIWQDTVTKNPESVTAHINFASALIKEKEFGKAKDELIAALKEKKLPFAQVSLIFDHLGVISLNEKNYAKAEEFFISSLRANPENVAAYNNFGFLCSEMADSVPRNAKRKEELLHQAVSHFEQALRYSPGFIQPMYNLGLSHLKLSEYGKAEQYFQRVVETDPRSNLSASSIQYLFVIEFAKRAPQGRT